MPNNAVLYAQNSSAIGECQPSTDNSIFIEVPSRNARRLSERIAPGVRLSSSAQDSIAARYGGCGLRHGFVPLPVSLQRHRRRLELTAALIDLIAALLSCSRGRELPHPSVAWLAAQLDVDERTIQRRIGRLIALGHVIVSPRRTMAGRQGANVYDLRPLLERADALDAGAREEEKRGVAATSPRIERQDLDPIRIPPTPAKPSPDIPAAEEPADEMLSCEQSPAGCRREEGRHSMAADTGESRLSPVPPADDLHQTGHAALASVLFPVLARCQEPTPAAALGQFFSLQQRTRQTPRAFAHALAEAVRRLEERLAAAQQGMQGPVRRPIAYLYAVLAQLLTDPPAPTEAPSETESRADAHVRTAVTLLATELGAPRPTSCGSRAVTLQRRSGLPPAAFWAVLREAADQTRRSTVRTTRKDGAPNAMPLFFTILKRMLRASEPWAKGRESLGQTQQWDHQQAGRIPSPASQITEHNPIWRSVLEELRATMTPTNFARCLASRVVNQSGDLLQVAVPSELARHWFDTCIRHRVEEAIARCGQLPVRVRFEVIAPPS